MSDEENNPEEASQAGIDEIMAGENGGSDSAGDSGDGGLSFNEMQDVLAEQQQQEQDYEIGEPMASDVTAIYDIPVQISAVLGRSNMQVSQLLKLGRGAVVELDRKVGEAIDIYVNNRLVARGEVVVVEDKLGITMTEIVKSDRN